MKYSLERMKTVRR